MNGSSATNSDVFTSLLRPPSSMAHSDVPFTPTDSASAKAGTLALSVTQTPHDAHSARKDVSSALPDSQHVVVFASATSETTNTGKRFRSESPKERINDDPATPPTHAHVATPKQSPAITQVPTASFDKSHPPTKVAPDEYGKSLDVTDALSYLDIVRVQFEAQPVTYNKFLDVMRLFKSSAIDTPGVIGHVSQLFQGYPQLIRGFNTFLPPGYEIKYSDSSNVISVTTPTGNVTYPAGQGSISPYIRAQLSHTNKLKDGNVAVLPPPMLEGQQQVSSHEASSLIVPERSFSRMTTPEVQKSSSPGVAPSASNAASLLGGLNRIPSDSAQKEPATEFHRAMTYINRIKTRFADRQEVYKAFLQLLQSYQKEQMSIKEAYAQVAVLFKDSPDLLEEFKIFLPDPSGPPPTHVASFQSQPVGTEGWLHSNPNDMDGVHSRRKFEAIPAPLKRKRRPLESRNPPSRGKRSRTITGTGKAEPSSPQPAHLQRTVFPSTQIPQSLSSQSFPAPPTEDVSLSFFEHVKRSFDTPVAYDEFLKLLQMFSMDIIDSKTLLERLESFLTDEQMDQFHELVGWDSDGPRVRDEAEGDSFLRRRAFQMMENATYRPRVMHIGPSYRTTPLTETGLACSNRDEHCRSVLNDKWESHPTWASEDGGFVTHKKNIYEEALYRSEDERHECQFHIEALSKTLALFEPLLQKLDDMSPEDKSSFKLSPSMGAASPSIHQRIIKKIYGREAGLEIIQSLYECPAYTLPIVVSRLRLKDEEWRRNQREWNKIWRDTDTRNFYKSLDSQGITFKPNDKKNTTTKAFVSQIEMIRESTIFAMSSESNLKDNQFLDYTLRDTEVLQDSLKLCCYFLDRQTLVYSAFERKAVERFLKKFIPMLISQDHGLLDISFTSAHNGREDEHEAQAGETALEEEIGDELNPTASLEGLDDVWILRAQSSSSDSQTILPGFNPEADAANEHNSVMFINTTCYVFLRLFQILYARLLTAKELSALMVEDKARSWVPNALSVELGLNDTTWSATAVSTSLAHGYELNQNHFYAYLLTSLEKLIDGELDQQSFEDFARVTFGMKAYSLFTLDKIVAGICKQVQSAVCDGKGMLSMVQEQIEKKVPSVREQIKYRVLAQLSANSDENVYRVDLNRSSATLRLRLLRHEDPSVRITDDTRYEIYVESYLLNHPTEGLGLKPEQPYLRRNVRQSNNEQVVGSRCGLSVAIREEDYRLKYASQSGDALVVRRSEQLLRDSQAASRIRKSEFPGGLEER